MSGERDSDPYPDLVGQPDENMRRLFRGMMDNPPPLAYEYVRFLRRDPCRRCGWVPPTPVYAVRDP